MNTSIRTFIAVELPRDVQAALTRLLRTLDKYRLNFRWVKIENVHLTLKFLGDVPLNAIQAVSTAMTAAAGEHVSLTLRGAGIGVFPTLRNPRVFWAGLAGDTEALRSLQATLEDHLSEQGFARENRPFKAHLTLGRARGSIDGRRIMEAMTACGEFSTHPFPVQSLTLFQSDLQKGGAVYTRLATAPLIEAAKA